ncbi:MAG: hypothetical protein AAFV53_37895 [Myxococcota bacterium]
MTKRTAQLTRECRAAMLAQIRDWGGWVTSRQIIAHFHDLWDVSGLAISQDLQLLCRGGALEKRQGTTHWLDDPSRPRILEYRAVGGER